MTPSYRCCKETPRLSVNDHISLLLILSSQRALKLLILITFFFRGSFNGTVLSCVDRYTLRQQSNPQDPSLMHKHHVSEEQKHFSSFPSVTQNTCYPPQNLLKYLKYIDNCIFSAGISICLPAFQDFPSVYVYLLGNHY